eukprot:CAMPEP_0185019930 /NCGR_PEP_ID=MMETSP1103-20130426/2514_1 /TAXON_ID=36769 /ORGANISM="Paraphysomonas bandaiensis, Strain Caron Lab Isolate" /LENGTH=313 /DNA_ID=CAMNT_0027550503 /DNA_START=712 /DNA_END=1653 /DNA_ORIENTATION=-
MSLTAVHGNVFLFGGSGPSSQRYDDLKVLMKLDSNEGEQYCWKTCVDVGESSRDVSVPTLDGDKEGMSDPDLVHCTIAVGGHGPGKRAGHTATAVGRLIYFIGGVFGNEFACSIHVLDTDSPPIVKVSSAPCTSLMRDRLRSLVRCEDMSDVVFLVDGRRVPGHRLVLSLACDRFRAMFQHGFQESRQLEVVLQETDYTTFCYLLDYMYTGEAPEPLQTLQSTHDTEDEKYSLTGAVVGKETVNQTLRLIEIADEYMMSHLKEMCEVALAPMVTFDIVEQVLAVAERCNAFQLMEVCRHMLRTFFYEKVDEFR